MGLDMYLDKAKRINGATAKEIRAIEEYFDWKLRPSKYKNSSMKHWCGIDQGEVNEELADEYIREYKTRYYGWDDKHEYGHLGLFDGVAYWRKANAIHKWFVDNVQGGEDDCGVYEVTKEQLEELLSVCKIVKKKSRLVKGKVSCGQRLENGEWKEILEDGAYITNPEVAEELLPTQGGFFFGGTCYDQWYMENIEYTIGALTEVLAKTNFKKEVVTYSSSW